MSSKPLALTAVDDPETELQVRALLEERIGTFVAGVRSGWVIALVAPDDGEVLLQAAAELAAAALRSARLDRTWPSARPPS